MNVCVVAEYYPRRRDPALGVWAHEQARAAAAAGADVRVLALERPIPPTAALRNPRALAGWARGVAGQPRTEVRDGIEVELVRFLSPPREMSYARWGDWARRPLERALERLDSRWHIDLVHAHYAVPAGAAARRWAERAGRPLVVSVHGGDVRGALLATPSARDTIAAVMRSAGRVLCNGEDTLQRSAAIAGGSASMRVVRLGARVPPEPRPPKHDRPTVATLGNVVPRKRHEDVLRALAALRGRVPDVSWVVIGDGPERARLERLASAEGVDARWLGHLDHDAALRELSRCHVMALPSVDEAFGVAYVEALAAGVPAVGARGEAGPEEIAALGPGMVLAEPRDPAGLADDLGALLADRGRLSRLASGGEATAREHFTWERCGTETVAVYEELLV